MGILDNLPSLPLDANGPEERIALIRAAHRLANAFWVWAIVVGLIGVIIATFATIVYNQTQVNTEKILILSGQIEKTYHLVTTRGGPQISFEADSRIRGVELHLDEYRRRIEKIEAHK